MKLLIAGATGLVGRTMLRVLEERDFPAEEVICAASERSAGMELPFRGRSLKVVTLEEGLAARPGLALFSAGAAVSREWAPRFAGNGCRVIDNSSAWRLNPEVPLVVPEINASAIEKGHYIIANPNCSTIQLVMALYPLHKAFGLERVVVSTYQSVTGTGKKAVDQWENERAGRNGPMVYPHPIDRNVLPACDIFLDNGYTREEVKVMEESRKILELPELRITATAVRVPVDGGHSESVNITFRKTVSPEAAREVLQSMPGVEVLDDPANDRYPMPLQAKGHDTVFVGRIRQDESVDSGLNLWIVSDNLRKGAATNAVQIAEYLSENHLV